MKRLPVFLLIGLFVAACSGEGEPPTSIPGDVSLTTATSPETTSPEATQPPETTEPPAAAEPPDTTEAPSDESDGIPVEWLVLIGILVIVAILLGVLIGRSRSARGGSSGSANGAE